MSVTVMMNVGMSKAMSAFGAEIIRACASKYGFDGEEAVRELNVEGVKKLKGEKVLKKLARSMPSIALPFTGTIREDSCQGVKQNHGLYTQCFSAPGESGLCKGCSKQASKNASGEPDCGLITKRVMQGADYRDPKGRAPVHFTKVMKKQNLTEEQVLLEAAKFGIEINASHFAEPEQQKRGRPKKATTSDTESENSSGSGEKKARGRPKKTAKVVESSASEDLFASLMQQAQNASPSTNTVEEVAENVSELSSDSESDGESSKKSKGSKKKSETAEEKAAKLQAKEQEKAAKEQEKEQEKAAKLQAKEQEKAAKLQAKEQEKAAKLQAKEQEKAAKLQAKEQEKAAKEQEKAAKLQAKEQAKAEKPAKKQKQAKKTEVAAPVEASVAEDLKSECESDDEEPVVKVKKFEYEGVTYLKSSDGIVYDAKSQEVFGKWNEETKTIDVYDCESEESEEEDN